MRNLDKGVLCSAQQTNECMDFNGECQHITSNRNQASTPVYSNLGIRGNLTFTATINTDFTLSG